MSSCGVKCSCSAVICLGQVVWRERKEGDEEKVLKKRTWNWSVEPSTRCLISAFGPFNLTHSHLKFTTFAFVSSSNVSLRVIRDNEVASHLVVANAENLCQQNSPDHNDFYMVFCLFFLQIISLLQTNLWSNSLTAQHVLHSPVLYFSRYILTSGIEVRLGGGGRFRCDSFPLLYFVVTEA